jgi:hypothetical protein
VAEKTDWSLGTYEGNRQRQHEEFRALAFRQKLCVIEELGRVARYFAGRRGAKRREAGAAKPGDNVTSER